MKFRQQTNLITSDSQILTLKKIVTIQQPERLRDTQKQIPQAKDLWSSNKISMTSILDPKRTDQFEILLPILK